MPNNWFNILIIVRIIASKELNIPLKKLPLYPRPRVKTRLLYFSSFFKKNAQLLVQWRIKNPVRESPQAPPFSGCTTSKSSMFNSKVAPGCQYKAGLHVRLITIQLKSCYLISISTLHAIIDINNISKPKGTWLDHFLDSSTHYTCIQEKKGINYGFCP